MAAYTQCGMTAMDALVAATSTNARLLELDRLGQVAAGKEAAFVVLDANPLDDITNTRRITAVYLRGQEASARRCEPNFRDDRNPREWPCCRWLVPGLTRTDSIGGNDANRRFEIEFLDSGVEA